MSGPRKSFARDPQAVRQDIYERACDALAHLGDFRRAPWSVQAQPSLEVAIKQLRAILQAVQS